jgi:hypothetical protein
MAAIKAFVRSIKGVAGMAVAVGILGVAANLWQKGLPISIFYALILIGLLVIGVSARNHYLDESEKRIKVFDESLTQLKPARVRAAVFLLRPEGNRYALDDILDFFEDLGSDLEDGKISKKDVYDKLWPWIQGYWESCYDYVVHENGQNKAVWRHIFYLYDTIKKYGREQTLSGEQLQEFLHGEAEL